MLHNDNYHNEVTTRNTTIDFIKGCCIIFMVWGHAAGPFKHWIYLFHIAVFFIASGILWDDSRVSDLHKCKSFIIRKLKSIWLPFVLCNSFFNLIHNFLLKTGIYSDNPDFAKLVKQANNYLQEYRTVPETCKAILKNLFFMGGSQLGGATWFLRTLFQISFTYMVIVYISNKFNIKKILFFISVIICITGSTIVSVYKLQMPLGIHSFFASFLAFLLGIVLNKAGISGKILKHKYKVFVISFLFFCLLNKTGKINISYGNITNVIFFLVSSTTGWFMLYSIASFQYIKENKILVFIGRHTLSILALHLLAFKIVTLIYILASNGNPLLLAVFPVIKKVPFLWTAYTFCGVTVPLFLWNIIYKQKGRLNKYEIHK